ncbi:MAG: glycosyltransferase [Candidatus Carbobacillus sp.]|nr:glycosyltransferase [Candidatus Carbobacillus sp.]
MKRICVLLPGKIIYDNRVIKTINVLNKYCFVDLYYTYSTPIDNDLFNSNTKLFACPPQNTIKQKILKHSFFIYEYNYIYNEVKKHNKVYDYIWANDLPVLKLAFKIKKKTNGKIIYDSHEIYCETINQFFPENAKGIKKLVFKGLISMMRFIGNRAEANMLKKTDFFVTVCHSVKEYFTKKYGRKDIHVVYNCPPLSNNTDKIDFKKILGISNNTFILLYQGVMNQGRALNQMIEAHQFTDEDIRFILMGNGSIKNHLISKTKSLGLEKKIIFIDPVHPSELLKYTRGADAGIVFQETDKNLSKKLGIANKFFEYMHAGIPFVATEAPENIHIVNQFPVCIFVNSKHDVLQIAQQINKLKNEPVKHMKEAALKAAKYYNWDKQAEVIKEIVK